MNRAFELDPRDTNRRNRDRAPVAIEAELRRPGRTPFKVLVRDLSQTGCRAETLSRTHVDDRAWVTLPGLAPLEGIIRWVQPREVGIQWITPIHSSVFEHISRKYPDLV